MIPKCVYMKVSVSLTRLCNWITWNTRNLIHILVLVYIYMRHQRLVAASKIKKGKKETHRKKSKCFLHQRLFPPESAGLSVCQQDETQLVGGPTHGPQKKSFRNFSQEVSPSSWYRTASSSARAAPLKYVWRNWPPANRQASVGRNHLRIGGNYKNTPKHKCQFTQTNAENVHKCCTLHDLYPVILLILWITVQAEVGLTPRLVFILFLNPAKSYGGCWL